MSIYQKVIATNTAPTTCISLVFEYLLKNKLIDFPITHYELRIKIQRIRNSLVLKFWREIRNNLII